MIRVTSVSSDELLVTRAFAGSTVDTIGNTAAFRLIGSAHAEAGALPGTKNSNVETIVSYTQIFERVAEFSGTFMATKQYGDGGNERKRLHKKMMNEVKEQINAALMWGKASEALTGGTMTQIGGTTSGPLRTTMGINSVISTNVVDCGGFLTWKTFLNFAKQAFRYGGSQKLLLASSTTVSAVNTWAHDRLQVKVGEQKYGINMTEIITPFGQWKMIYDKELENYGSTTNGFSGVTFSIDLEQIEEKYLSYGGENRDLQLYEDVVSDGSDRRVDKILGELGFMVAQEKHHAKLFNIQDWA